MHSSTEVLAIKSSGNPSIKLSPNGGNAIDFNVCFSPLIKQLL